MNYKCNKCAHEGTEAGKCTACNEGEMVQVEAQTETAEPTTEPTTEPVAE